MSIFTSAQTGNVGINTTTPNTTLDVSAKRNSVNGVIENNNQAIALQAPRLTRAELTSNTFSWGNAQVGALIYITDVSEGNTSTPRTNISTTGYYYFDGNLWQKISDVSSVQNIYTANGDVSPLSGTPINRTVNFTGGGSLNFDENTLYLDTTNDRVSIGTKNGLGKFNVYASNYWTGVFRRLNGTSSLQLQRSNDSDFGSTTAATNLQELGRLAFSGANGSSFNDGAWIAGIATENYTSSALGTRIDFITTSNGSTSRQNRMTINHNGNVGINTSSPTHTFQVASSSFAQASILRGGTGNTSSANLYFQRTNNTAFTNNAVVQDGDMIGRIYFQANNGSGYSSNGNVQIRAIAIGDQTSFTAGALHFGTTPTNSTSNFVRMAITETGNVAIGQDFTAPTTRLEVDGAITNRTALNAGANASINFSNSNLAYTSTASDTITLIGVKDGGAYILISTSTVAGGTVTFTPPSGFTIVNMFNVTRTLGKRHMYNFIVAGNEIYVTMETEQ